MNLKIVIPEKKYAKYMTIFCKALLVLTFMYLLCSWSRLPGKIPLHYNGAGEIDGWGSKWTLWFLYVVSLLMYGGISLTERHPDIWNTGVTVTRNNRDMVYLLLKHLIVTLKAGVTLIFCYLSIWTTTGKDLQGWFMPAALLLVFGPLAFYLIRMARIPK